MSAQSKHIPELDGVRGVACLAILIVHCMVGLIDSTSYPNLYVHKYPLQVLLLGGVDLFFVLSGFLIGGILIDNRNAPNFFRAFWTRRIARIFPVYFLLIVTYALALFALQTFNLKSLGIWLLLEPRPPWWSLVTFMQNYPIAAGGYGGPRWIGITWSVAIEEQFYMFFPLAVYFMTRRVLATFAIFAIVLLVPVLRIVVEWYYGSWYAAYVWPLCRMDGLLCGVIVTIIVRTPSLLALAVRWRRLLDVGLLALLYMNYAGWFLLPYPFNGARFSALSIMFSIMIMRIFLVPAMDPYRRVLRSAMLAWFGLISYALYMYHQAINGLVHALLFGQEPTIKNWHHWLAAGVVMLIAIGLAKLSHDWFEAPIRRHGQQVKFGVLDSPGRAGSFAKGVA